MKNRCREKLGCETIQEIGVANTQNPTPVSHLTLKQLANQLPKWVLVTTEKWRDKETTAPTGFLP